MAVKKPKTFADCSIYAKVDESGYSTERALVSFIMTANRIDISSNAFKGVVEQLKSRSQNAIIIRMLQQGNVVLGMAGKELSPSLKVFYAKDIKSNTKSRKVFVDATNLIVLENGFFVCKDINRLAAYLLGVLVMEVYYNEPNKFITNGNLQKLSVTAFIKLFNAILNDQRLPGYIANKAKIQYISGVYFGVTVMGLEMSQARLAAQSAMSMSKQDAANADFYYKEEDLKDIYTFLQYLIDTFKLKGLASDGFINKWIYSYGKGTMYALELYPAFLTLIMYACSGSYINNMKRIENTLSKELVDIENIVIRVGNDTYTKGFKYESMEDRKIYERNFHEFYEAAGIDLKAFTEETNPIDKIVPSTNNNNNTSAPTTPPPASASTSSTASTPAPKPPVSATASTSSASTSTPPASAGSNNGIVDFKDNGAIKMSTSAQDAADSSAKLPVSKQGNNMTEAGELDPSQITDDAIKEEIKDTPNNGETQDLIDEIDKDKPMNEAGTCDFDPHLISKEMIQSEDKDQGTETPGEVKAYVDSIKKDAPMYESMNDYINAKIAMLEAQTKDFDPDKITQDAIDGEKKDTPNNGELDDLKDEIVDDIVLK